MLPSVARDYEGPVRVIIADKYSVSYSAIACDVQKVLFFGHGIVYIVGLLKNCVLLLLERMLLRRIRIHLVSENLRLSESLEFI